MKTITAIIIFIVLMIMPACDKEENNRNVIDSDPDNENTVPDNENQDGSLPVEDEDKAAENDSNNSDIENTGDSSENNDEPSVSDSDTTDLCPDNIEKTDPGVCGCDVLDIDTDGDDLMDCVDNCVETQNIDQIDTDKDKIGDACDNCPYHANRKQTDSDSDGIGDACQNDTLAIDTDLDGIFDYADNCVNTENADQADNDTDGIGNACDNCPGAANNDQADSDSDGTGDECEGLPFSSDLDKDGIDNNADNCIKDPNTDQLDSDGDGVGDICDNCVNYPNNNQVDNNGNGTGDACETITLPPEDVCEAKDIAGSRIKPNIYYLLDNSGSMDLCVNGSDNCSGKSTSRWNILLSAMNSQANSLSTQFNVGAAYFPDSNTNAKECIDLKPDTVFNNFNACNIAPGGGTPTGPALDLVRTNQWYKFTPDTLDSSRGKAVVVVTDGLPEENGYSNAQALDRAKTASATLKNAGVPVYFVGYAGLNDSNMTALAVAGGTTSWYQVNDSASIQNALKAIAATMMPCTVSLPLTGGDDDPTRMEISINNNGTLTAIAPGVPNGWTYDDSTDTLILNGSSCTDLKNIASSAADPSKVGITAEVACIENCVSVPEFCDGKDNNCNGLSDDGITCECTYEICADNIDNDCDNQIDEGCPDPDECIPAPEICDEIDNNCNDQIDEGCSIDS